MGVSMNDLVNIMKKLSMKLKESKEEHIEGFGKG